MVSLGARVYLGERLHRMQWIGVAVSATRSGERRTRRENSRPTRRMKVTCGRRAGRLFDPAARTPQLIFATSLRILSGSGNSPLPYFSTTRIFPVLSTMNVARLFAFQSGQ